MHVRLSVQGYLAHKKHPWTQVYNGIHLDKFDPGSVVPEEVKIWRIRFRQTVTSDLSTSGKL